MSNSVGTGGHWNDLAECPMCENYEAHARTANGMFTCALCNTSWGGGEQSSGLGPRWLPQPPPIR
jgi:ribosomal protein L37AE/L43A